MTSALLALALLAAAPAARTPVVVELYTSEGVLLVQDDDSGLNSPAGPGQNAAIANYVLPATDTYVVSATGAGGSRGPYELYLTTSSAAQVGAGKSQQLNPGKIQPPRPISPRPTSSCVQ